MEDGENYLALLHYNVMQTLTNLHPGGITTYSMPVIMFEINLVLFVE